MHIPFFGSLNQFWKNDEFCNELNESLHHSLPFWVGWDELKEALKAFLKYYWHTTTLNVRNKDFKCLAFSLFSEKELLRMVREVSEDRIYDTIEFNEFLQMLSKQQRNYTQDSLRDAFRYKSHFSPAFCAFDFLELFWLRFPTFVNF